MKNIFFYHVTKTAGTSLRNLLRNNYEAAEIYDSCANADGPNAGSDFLHERPGMYEEHSCFMGHYRPEILPRIPKLFFRFTFLRHPVSRAVSWFYYLKSAGLLESSMELREFFYSVPSMPKDSRCPAISYFKQSTNAYVRFFGNHLDKGFHEINNDHYHDAMESLQNNFDFIGFQERYEESAFMLSKLAGFDNIFYERLRETPESSKISDHRKELGDSLYNRIVEYNQYDIKLYENVLQKSEAHFAGFMTKYAAEFERSKTNRPEKAALRDSFMS
ncbi:sulfotransferase family 2 domain-containing protein [Maridesulfovibrio sp.]|uniref:sulfotransferase family 2 domain-containing protein n=1 Tax=Maridesulfovibrio sp. TaxID=2795000 RepID=UPI002AA8AC52|nr:sulfotransferase family 2 domain-containing protein [Maridesulfovibrio sp.]